MAPTDCNESSNSSISGKLVIISILLVALLGAGISWYVRYRATHRAAQFWNTGSAELIRDAAQVRLQILPAAGEAKTSIDVSQGRGLTHLRNALLVDHNFVWPELDAAEIRANEPLDWKWVLDFRDSANDKSVAILFTKDCTLARRKMSSKEAASVRATAIRTTPTMARGLQEMFEEFMGTTSGDSGIVKQPAATDGAAEVR